MVINFESEITLKYFKQSKCVVVAHCSDFFSMAETFDAIVSRDFNRLPLLWKHVLASHE